MHSASCTDDYSPAHPMTVFRDRENRLRRLQMARDRKVVLGSEEGAAWSVPLLDFAHGAMIDGIHEADLARGGMGYMDPKEGRVATQHGFRSTFRDWASEVGYFDKEIVEHAIAHKLQDKAEAAYQRGTLLMKRALMMERWGRFCRTPGFSMSMIRHVTLHQTPEHA